MWWQSLKAQASGTYTVLPLRGRRSLGKLQVTTVNHRLSSWRAMTMRWTWLVPS
jgi:hypothetical protein